MRLIHSSTLELKDFPSDRIPPYAIFSHTWGIDEVLHADMENGTAKDKAGYGKITFACSQAAADNIDYVWADTCCIDKKSSAELSESINSMYLWYKKSRICYAYLADVPSDVNAEGWESALAASRWFRRGWTLQELIAPPDLRFFSYDWVNIGTKLTLRNIVVEITGIDVEILIGKRGPESTSVAKRMSWASQRSTTRVEDVAYSLMGLFDVNMPLLYGEGEKAFMRLQEEIMKQSDDQSLFAWINPDVHEDSHHGLLAQSPADFSNSADVVPYRSSGLSNPFSMSNKGLRIELPLRYRDKNIYMGALDCPVPPLHEGYLGIYLKRMPYGEHQYVRLEAGRHHQVSSTKRGKPQFIYVRQHQINPEYLDVYPLHILQLRRGPGKDFYRLISVYSQSDAFHPPASSAQLCDWTPDNTRHTFRIRKLKNQLAAALLFELSGGKRFVVLLGSTTEFDVGFSAAPMQNLESVEELHRAYEPQRMGSAVTFEDFWIRVDIETNIFSQAKYYMVDISIGNISEPLLGSWTLPQNISGTPS